MNFAGVRISVACWKRDEFSSARFGGVRSVFSEEWAPEVKADPVQGRQRAYVERLIGSLRRECLDHIIVFGERSLRRALASYVSYYHSWRTHLSLGKDAPQFRRTQACAEGKVVEIREVGGLHHHYERQAA